MIEPYLFENYKGYKISIQVIPTVYCREVINTTYMGLAYKFSPNTPDHSGFHSSAEALLVYLKKQIDMDLQEIDILTICGYPAKKRSDLYTENGQRDAELDVVYYGRKGSMDSPYWKLYLWTSYNQYYEATGITISKAEETLRNYLDDADEFDDEFAMID